MDVAATYDRAFFARHEPWRADYDAIADILARRLRFATVLDLGCGSGFLIGRLARLGKIVAGVDGSSLAHEFAPAEIRDRIAIRDLAVSFPPGRYDLVICTEVAEHLPAALADHLVETICGNAAAWVFFTAATPGQGGHGHINEQPHGYWIAKFRRHGFAPHERASLLLRRELSQAVKNVRWFPQNALLFCRLPSLAHG